jgi:hypothetical protein
VIYLKKAFLGGILILVIGVIVLTVGPPIGYSEAPVEMGEWKITWFRIFSAPTDITSLNTIGIAVNETSLPANFDFIMSDPDFIPYTGSADEIGLMARTEIRVPNDGKIRFEVGSDDGSVLLLDGEIVIDNWGLHGYEPRSTVISLKEGTHTLEIWWFEWHGAAVLSFKMDEKVTFGDPWYGRAIGGAIVIVGLAMMVVFKPKRGER